MSEQNNGGAAFPSPNNVRVGDCISGGHQGMDMRDYFAAKAIPIASRLDFAYRDDAQTIDAEAVAFLAYEIADAMLKARQG